VKGERLCRAPNGQCGAGHCEFASGSVPSKGRRWLGGGPGWQPGGKGRVSAGTHPEHDANTQCESPSKPRQSLSPGKAHISPKGLGQPRLVAGPGYSKRKGRRDRRKGAQEGGQAEKGGGREKGARRGRPGILRGDGGREGRASALGRQG